MRVLIVTLAVVLCDQATKVAVRGGEIPFLGVAWKGMDYGTSLPVLGDWLKITFIENPNMAFGIQLAGQYVLVLFSAIAALGVIWYLYRHRHGALPLRLALALVLAGAVGNLIDRSLYGVVYGYAPLFQGHVVDFIDLDLFRIRWGDWVFKVWPIFNIADAAVTVGVVLLLFTMKPQHAERNEETAANPMPGKEAAGQPVESQPDDESG
ncbi:MAG: signal peptidase II [Bacteroidota bacterium]|nr:signal peptidase II [Bacteroidota bacterium]